MRPIDILKQQNAEPSDKVAILPRNGYVRLSSDEASLLYIVELWNSKAQETRNYQHNLTAHAYDNSGYASKTVKKALQSLVYIKEGTTYQNLPKLRPVNAQTVLQGNRTVSLDIKMFKIALDRFVMACRKEYYPTDKANMPKNLPDFIYKTSNKNLPESLDGESWMLEMLYSKPAQIDYDECFYMTKVEQLDSYHLIKSKVILTAAGQDRFLKVMARNLSEWKKLRNLNYMLYKSVNEKAEELFTDPDKFFLMLFRFITEVYLHYEHNFSIGHFVWERATIQSYLSEFSDKVLQGRNLYPSQQQAWATAKGRSETMKQEGYNVITIDSDRVSWYSEEDILFARENNLILWWEI